MTVEKSAVREGTRWDFCGQVVVVDEVTPRSIIHREEHGFGDAKVTSIEQFLSRASDPGVAMHARLLDGLRHASHDLPTKGPTGQLLELLRDAVFYQLERMPPGIPVYRAPEPVNPKAKPAPAIVEVEAVSAKPDEPCDYAVAIPAMEPLPEDEPRFGKKRRFSGL
jgi:hypothetical protein